MRGLVKTIIALLAIATAATWSRAQAPIPAPARPGVPPPPVVFSGQNTNTGRAAPSFFNRPGATNVTPRTTVNSPAIPTPGGVTPGFPAPGASGSRFGGTNTAGVSNVVPKITGETIPAGMIHFQELDIQSVLDFYADLMGRTILKSPQTPANVKISLQNKTPLTRQEGIDALNTILGLNGITMVEEGEKFIKAVPSASAPQEAPPFTTNTASLRPSKQIVAQIVHLKNITGDEAQGIIAPFTSLPNSVIAVKGSPILIMRDYSENVQRMLDILEKIDVALPTSIEMVVIPIKYALANDVASVLSGLSAGGSTVSFGSSQAGGLTGGITSPGGLGTQGGFGSSPYGGSSFGSGVNRLGSGLSSGMGGSYGTRGLGTTTGLGGGGLGSRSGFNSRLNAAVSRATTAAGSAGGQGEIQLIGQAKIIADERSNALLVFAERNDLPMITNIISKLDVVLPQVLIEALILEVNIGSGQTLGVSMSQNQQQNGKLTTVGASQNGGFIDPKNVLGSFLPGTSTNQTGGTAPSGFSYFGSYGKDFDFAVTAAANDSRINVLSRPRIQTSTAQSATIFVGEQRPFITGSYFSDFSGVGSRSQYALQDIGISLTVQPIINQEGLVTMTIAQDISQVGGTTKIDNNDVPITIHRTANAYVSVHDRDTIILGGFISTTKNKSTAGVPFLKDIPGLGMLFRSSSENINRVELVVLIRPTVLPTPESAALTAAEERSRMPSINRAQRDEEEFNQRQMEKDRLEEQRAIRRRNP
jgi:general secretion pathway protein D